MKIETNYMCSIFVLLYLKGIISGCVTIYAFEFQIFESLSNCFYANECLFMSQNLRIF